MKKKKFKDRITLNPIMTFLILMVVIIVLSGILSFIGLESTYNTYNSSTGEYTSTLVSVFNLFSLSGLKYIFTSTVSNFVAFTPLSMLIIVLTGIGIMEKSGFLKTAFTLVSKYCKKNTVTFVLILISVLSSIMGDLGYIILIPMGALLFLHGRRNPIAGIIASFAGLTCGSGLSVLFTSVDSELLKSTLIGASVLDPKYNLSTGCFIFIMLVAVILVSIVITILTEKVVSPRLPKYEFEELEEDVVIGRKELKGLIYAIGAGLIYLIIFIYNIIPGLPFSGNFLDNTQVFYIDKLFSYNSFFNNGFVFIVTMLFIIWGLFYGIGAKTIKNNNDMCDYLTHSLDGTGKTLVLIFFASALINIFKKSEIGTVVISLIANLLEKSSFSGIPLIILFFILTVIGTLLVPASNTKYAILSGTIIPLLMNAGITPEFGQVIFRFAECVTTGLTPLFAYYVIYLSFIEKYNQDDKPISLFKTLKYQLPYSLATGGILIILIIIWYLIGLPIGIGGQAIL